MEKKEIFSKINIKDYNNQLEKIVEKKSFSGDVKSLLLSMLYKIETSYSDYNKVKVDTATKKEFIQEIFKIIENECNQIKLTKKINEQINEKQTVYVYNEQSLIISLYNLKNKFNIDDKYDLIKKPMEELLNIAYNNDKSEVIRDFDGWAWNINKTNINNITYNLIFQNIKYLTNNKFIENWRDNQENKDYMQELKKVLIERYTKLTGENILEIIIRISVFEYLSKFSNETQKFIEAEKILTKQLSKISNKTEYIQEIVEKKKQISKKINCLDKTINNRTILEQEFINRNKNLKENEKIFSLSDLIETLFKEREELIKELKRCNDLIKPTNYISAKIQLEHQVNFLLSLDLKDNNHTEKIWKNLVLLQKEFLKALEKEFDSKETKKQITDMLYVLRYYKRLPINDTIIVSDVQELKSTINRIEKKLITKACNLKVINIISYDIQTNFKITSKILNTKIINLNEIVIELKKDDIKNIINIYEDNTIDSKIELLNKEEINLKYNKKIKLFI